MLKFGEISELAIDLAEHLCKELCKGDDGLFDETEAGWLGKMMELEINLRQGNITLEQYRNEILQIRKKHQERVENLVWI